MCSEMCFRRIAVMRLNCDESWSKHEIKWKSGVLDEREHGKGLRFINVNKLRQALSRHVEGNVAG